MTINSIRRTVSKAYDAMDTNIAESLVTIEAIAIAAETMTRSSAATDAASFKMATHIICLADRAKREVAAASDHGGTIIDAVMIDQTPPAGIPSAAQVRAEDFAAALVSYERATEAMEANYRDHMTPANQAMDAATAGTPEHAAAFAAVDAAQDVFGGFVTGQSDALAAVFQAPAPDVAAVATKLQLWAKHEYSGFTDADEMMQAIADDTARLSQQGEA